jgi:hypothetical protein
MYYNAAFEAGKFRLKRPPDMSSRDDHSPQQKGKLTMPKYVIERELPGAGKMSAQQLQTIAQKSCGVLREMGAQIQWLQSYVTDDKIYCLYIAPNEKLVREHAKQGGFPANRVSRVTAQIDPTTAE